MMMLFYLILIQKKIKVEKQDIKNTTDFKSVAWKNMEMTRFELVCCYRQKQSFVTSFIYLFIFILDLIQKITSLLNSVLNNT